MAWFPKKSIVVPVDFSDESIEAVDTGLQLIANPVDLHVIHVLAEMVATEPGIVWELVDDESRRQHALDALTERFSKTPYRGIDVQVDFGDPGHQIADFAKKVAADLIVLPSHGRTGLARLLIGSVAERVVRLAHCPVLVLRK